MKESNLLSNVSQKEALINEYKGNLFEYLVAQSLARHYGIESSFLHSFKGAMKTRLAQYESWLRRHDPELVLALPLLAQELSQSLASKMKLESVSQVYVVGKEAAGGGDDSLNEADIILQTSKGAKPLSIKLCKKGAFVNTKSGGIKSFLGRYFFRFPEHRLAQEELNQFLEQSFQMMAHQVHEKQGIEYPGDFDLWRSEGLSELPGEQSDEVKEVIHHFYSELISQIYRVLEGFFRHDQNLFVRCLYPLVGLGTHHMVQATCFHLEKIEEGVKKRYQSGGTHVEEMSDFEKRVKSISLGGLRPKLSSFEIHFHDLTLQIRVKPMNKFTVPALKINCSIRHQ